MKFSFVCPKTGGVFESADFRVVDNRGVTLDKFGNKMLDAGVELTRPCPLCTEKHTYHARELLCPFGTKKS
jgi:hypothetical protein